MILIWNRDGEEVEEGWPPQHFTLMSNIYIASNTNVECESFLRQATTGVVYALAPMEIVEELAAFNIPSADVSRSTATCNADIAGDVMSRTMR